MIMPMNILYVGDVMGEIGMKVVEQVLPKLRNEKGIDLVIAQAENVSEGKGMTVADYQRLKTAGVDGFSGGNHTMSRAELAPLLSDPASPVIGPANMPDCPGPGYKYVGSGDKQVLMISLLGQIVGKDAARETKNPLLAVDEILEREAENAQCVVVNFHGDFSSEKVVIGHYLDGRVTAVVGDHWHVPTADARILPAGTAHLTDVGMCGALNSSLGVEYDSIIPRWKTGHPTKNVLATAPPYQFNALLVRVNAEGLADGVEQIQQTLEG
jgi:metallophosphoesterase (TIGR00282 family)